MRGVTGKEGEGADAVLVETKDVLRGKRVCVVGLAGRLEQVGLRGRPAVRPPERRGRREREGLGLCFGVASSSF